MKKRTLIASIAMLVVSAIVLSTSTYAWFSAGSTVSVEQLTASVQNTDGSIEIAAASTGPWSNIVTASALQDISTNLFPAQLVPVSVTPATPLIVAGGLTETTYDHDENAATPAVAVNSFSATGAATAGYLKATIYVRAAQAGTTATLTATFASGQTFLFGMVRSGSTYKHLGNGTYSPIAATTAADLLDTNNDDIISATEGGTSVGSELSTTASTDTLTLTFTNANDVVAVDIYIWAEGQEASCSGAIAASQASIDVSIVKN